MNDHQRTLARKQGRPAGYSGGVGIEVGEINGGAEGGLMASEFAVNDKAKPPEYVKGGYWRSGYCDTDTAYEGG